MRNSVPGRGRIQRRDFVTGIMLGTLGRSFAGVISPTQTEARVGNQEAGTRAVEPPGSKMVPWVFCHSPLERYMADYQRTFDAWEDGGVRGIVVGYMRFYQEITPFEMSYQFQYA